MVYWPLAWLDNTHLYMTGLFTGTQTPPRTQEQTQDLSLFDTTTGKIKPVLTFPLGSNTEN